MNNQKNERNNALYRAYLQSPSDYLSHVGYKRPIAILSRSKHPPLATGEVVDPFRHTETLFNRRASREILQSSERDIIVAVREGSAELKKGKRKRTVSKLKQMEKSPYLSNSADVQKMFRLLNPVSGPNQSLKQQIKKYNQSHLRNAQNLIFNRVDSFQERMKAYSNRLGFDQEVRIFTMNSKDVHIRNALLNRGWVESADKDSVFYHLKWVYNDTPVDYARMQDGQFYNHFKHNQELTNKNLFRKNLKRSPQAQRPSYPISYDLDLNQDQTDFQEEYQKFQTIRFFQNFNYYMKNKYSKLYERVLKNCNYFTHFKKLKGSLESKKETVQKLLYNRAVSEIRENSRSLSESLNSLYEIVSYLSQVVSQLLNLKYSVFVSKGDRDRVKFVRKVEQQMYYNMEGLLSQLSPFYLVQLIKLWKHIEGTFGKNYGCDNMWIVKPTGVSRGSGITITTDMSKIAALKYGKIVQKYLQKPLILNCGRKFDIRQWVLIRRFQPLQAYTFNQCYARFSSVKYSNDAYENPQKHLTNYSKNKEFYFRQKLSLHRDPCTFNLSSVMSEAELQMALGYQEWQRIKDQILLDIFKTLNCCKNEIIQRQGCFQVYGFDIILDSQKKPYILEVNMSPACDNREPFLGNYLETMAEGIADLLDGKEPSHWIKMQARELQEKAKKRKDKKTREEAARRIQKAWRSK